MYAAALKVRALYFVTALLYRQALPPLRRITQPPLFIFFDIAAKPTVSV